MARRLTGRLSRQKRSAPARRFSNLENVTHTLKSLFFLVIFRTKSAVKKAGLFVEKRPLQSFFGVLLLLLILILLGSFLRRPAVEKPVEKEPVEVSIYSIGTAPTLSVSAQIEKTGVVKIISQTSGIINQINVTEGQEVSAGTNLISISSNYSGGSAASVQRQIAADTYQNIKDTYGTQKDIIQKQRDLADKNRDNTNALRDISAKSLDDTRSLLNLNQNIVDTLNTNLTNLENSNTNGSNDATILQTKQLISSFQSAVNQLKSAVKTAEFQTDANNPPTGLTDITHDVTIKQLDVQKKALELSLEVSRLQLQLAQIQESTMFPSAPISGVIERIYVTPNQSVTPGTPLLLLHGAQTAKVVAKVPPDIAQKASYTQPSKIYIGSKTFSRVPMYISTEATDGTLYSVIYSLPDNTQNNITDKSFVKVDLPVGLPSTGISDPFIPIDAVYQSQSSSYIFLSQNGKAQLKTVTLGNVVGDYVEVLSGISTGDKIILDRTVVAGDKVKEIQ